MHDRMGYRCGIRERRDVGEGCWVLRVESGKSGGILTGRASVESIEGRSFTVQLCLCAKHQRLNLITPQTDPVIERNPSSPAIALHQFLSLRKRGHLLSLLSEPHRVPSCQGHFHNIEHSLHAAIAPLLHVLQWLLSSSECV